MTKSNEMKTCARLRHNTAFEAGYLPTSRISTQNEVVRAVNAESALEKAAAIIPMQKNNSNGNPKYCVAKNGSISSLRAGIAICC